MPGVTRVAFTSLAPFISGAERSLQVTLRHLPGAGVEPLVIGPSGAKIAPWCGRQGIPFLACPLPLRDKWHPLRWWRSVRRLRELLKEWRVDLVHANQMWSYPAAGAAARPLGIPRVCHLRDEADAATLRWCCSAGLEAVVCISQHVARQAEAAWPAGSGRPLIATLVNPVDLPGLGDGTHEGAGRAAARRSFGVPEGTTVFGFIGQLREVKGLLGLLDALAALTAGRPWHLLVAGSDPTPGSSYGRLCRDRAGKPDLAGRVTFLGFLEDVSPFYQAIDLAVVPSHQEPLGRVPLEAGAFAKPAVAFATGGLPDTIRNAETGWLIPPGDWPALAAALRRFLESSADDLGRQARAWVEETAEPAAYARRLTALYRQLLSQDSEAARAKCQPVTCSRS